MPPKRPMQRPAVPQANRRPVRAGMPVPARPGFQQAARRGMVSPERTQRIISARNSFRARMQAASRQATGRPQAEAGRRLIRIKKRLAFPGVKRAPLPFSRMPVAARARLLERRPAIERPALRPPQERFQRARNGLRRVAAAGYRAVKPVAEREAGRLAESGSNLLNETSATIHYGLGEGVSTAGDLARHTIGTGFRAAGEVGKTAVSTAASVGTGVAGSTISAAGEVVGGTASGAINAAGNIVGRTANAAISTAGNLVADGAVYGVGLVDRGIRFGARTGAKTARGLFITMPKALARRVLQYIGDRRAVSRIVNPNLGGNWKLVFRPEGVAVTSDGFVQHTIKKVLKLKSGERIPFEVSVEYGFNEKGRLTARASPVLTGNKEHDDFIQKVYAKKFRNVRLGIRSLTRRLGGAKGIGEIRETALSAEAFPEQPYAEPPSEVVRASGPVPENAALTDAEIGEAFRQARAQRQGAPVEA